MSVAELFGTAAHKHTGIEWMDYETQLPTHNEILYSIKKAPFVTVHNKMGNSFKCNIQEKNTRSKMSFTIKEMVEKYFCCWKLRYWLYSREKEKVL